jgi:hypothetical protein
VLSAIGHLLTIAALGELREESIAPDAREAMLEAFPGWRS